MARKTKHTKEYVFSLDEGDAISITLLQKSGIGLPNTDLSTEEWEEDWCFVLETPQLCAYRLNGDVEWVYDLAKGWSKYRS